MTLPTWAALLVAAAAVAASVGEVLRASRRREPVRVVRVAASAVVAVFAIAAAALLASAAQGGIGVPRRYASYSPGDGGPQPAPLLLVAGLVAGAAGLVRSDRSARAAQRVGHEVTRADRAANVSIVLAGVGLMGLGLLVLVV